MQRQTIMLNIINNSFFKNTFTRLDNWINPIVVKEMRQAVRSRYIILLLQLYLFLEALMVGSTFLATDTIFEAHSGVGLFYSLTFVLFFTNLFCVPVYTSNRLWKEVKQGDAMFSSTLTPMQIVRGKFFSGMIISLLFFSASIPFVMLTYLMRGLDMSTIILTLYGIFLMIQILNSCGIAFGAMKLNPIIRVIIGFLASIWIIGLLTDGLSFTSWFPDTSIYVFMTITLLAVFLCEMFLILAGSLLSPLSSNRMTQPRIFITGFSIILTIVSSLASIMTGDIDILDITSSCIFILMLLVLAIGLCERFKLSPRQIQQIPRNPLLRFVYFPFFTFVGSAIAWFIMMFVLMYVLTFTFINSVGVFHNQNIFYHIAELTNNWEFHFGFMCLSYMTAGLAIRMGVDYWRRTRLAQRISKEPDIIIYPTPQSGITTVLYAGILTAISTAVPMILLYNMSDNYLLCFSPLYYHTAYNWDMSKISPLVPISFGAISILFLIFLSIHSFIVYYLEGAKAHRQKQTTGN